MRQHIDYQHWQHQQHSTDTNLVCRDAAVTVTRSSSAVIRVAPRRRLPGRTSTSNVTSHDTSGGRLHTSGRSSRGELQLFLILPCTCLLYSRTQTAPLLVGRIILPPQCRRLIFVWAGWGWQDTAVAGPPQGAHPRSIYTCTRNKEKLRSCGGASLARLRDGPGRIFH